MTQIYNAFQWSLFQVERWGNFTLLFTLEGELAPTHFFRISRSCILADNAIGSISKLLGGRMRVVLPDGLRARTDLSVSRARVEGFLAWLER